MKFSFSGLVILVLAFFLFMCFGASLINSLASDLLGSTSASTSQGAHAIAIGLINIGSGTVHQESYTTVERTGTENSGKGKSDPTILIVIILLAALIACLLGLVFLPRRREQY